MVASTALNMSVGDQMTATSATSASAEPGRPSKRQTVIFLFWLYPAIAIPFGILGAWGGFGEAFEGGGASAFMCGAIVAAVGECVIDNYKDGFKRRFKATRGERRLAAIGALTLVTGFFWWNMFYAVADRTAAHPGVDAAQVIAFIITALFLPQARFAFTETPTPTVGDMLRLVAGALGSLMARLGHEFMPAPDEVVPADEAVPPAAPESP